MHGPLTSKNALIRQTTTAGQVVPEKCMSTQHISRSQLFGKVTSVAINRLETSMHTQHHVNAGDHVER